MSYPKWIYHKTEAAKIVNTEVEHEQAGEGWEETPAAFDEKSDETPAEPKGNQEPGNKEPDIKEVDFTKMSVKELTEALVKNGVEEKSLKGKKKDELIAMLGAI
jgi:hypothetical protein